MEASGRSDRMSCPCCGGTGLTFLPFGVVPRPHAQCPICGSLERHRLMWLYLRDRTDLFEAHRTLLHLAPEAVLSRALRQRPNLRYLSADLEPAGAMIAADITRLPCRDSSIDVILCSHVLEHVPDDRRAMRELARVLSSDGWAIIQSPMDSERERTFEDPSVVDPAERERLFGQRDHVRVYGRDYRDRLVSAGFDVRMERFSTELGSERRGLYGLLEEDLFVCRPRDVSG